jgi:response regulator RpfG family c-di-GMP phosphodiesterase
MADESVLIVDDEQVIRSLCMDILTKHGYRPVATAGGREALSLLGDTREEFDLILVDIRMPEMDGFRFLEAARERHLDIPIVFMTGQGTLQHALHALEAGAQGIVLKPFTPNELVCSVEQVLERRDLLRENARLRALIPLLEVTRNLVGASEIKDFLQDILRVACRETGADGGLILIAGPGATVRIEETASFPPEERATCESTARLLFEEVRERRVPFTLSPTQARLPPAVRVCMERFQMGSLLVMPLIFRERLVGQILLCRRIGRPPYRQGDLGLLSVLCGHMAAAIENVRLYAALEEKHRSLEEAMFDAVEALAQAVEAKDAYTRGHCARTARYALEVGRRLGVAEEDLEYLKYAAVLHDVGKIGIAEAILKKPGSLEPDERDAVEQHPRHGADIIGQVRFLRPVVPLILHHQERWDGKGYPDRLTGEAIPMGSRILAVLDAFDAMTTDRSYRAALPLATAIEELQREAGKQFDPHVVQVFMEVLEEEYRKDLPRLCRAGA